MIYVNNKWGVFYRDVEIFAPYAEETEVKKKERELEGIQMNGQQKNDKMYTLVEFHVDLDLEGFEDRSPDGMPTGIKVPYIVTVDSSSRKILSIRRNFKVDDPKKLKIQYFVHFKFLPGLGFYGFGLIHMIGGLTKSSNGCPTSVNRCRYVIKFTSRI